MNLNFITIFIFFVIQVIFLHGLGDSGYSMLFIVYNLTDNYILVMVLLFFASIKFVTS